METFVVLAMIFFMFAAGLIFLGTAGMILFALIEDYEYYKQKRKRGF